MKFNNYITHIDNEEDLPFLKTKLFDVNIRLLKSSRPYRKLIQRACDYIEFLCSTEMDGYKKPHGMSGANAGIPFNIIAYQQHRNTDKERTVVMINPKITHYSDEKITAATNCGSIRLKESIFVERSKYITMYWHDIVGNQHYGSFERLTNSLTIQHEVDHNLGILITDKEVKYEYVY